MIRLNNRKVVFKGLAWLIFTALLVDLAFSHSLAVFASHDPNMKLPDALSAPGSLRTPPAPGTVLSTLLTVHVYLPLVIKAGGGPVVTPTATTTRVVTPTATTTRVVTPTATTTQTSPPPGSQGALFLNRIKRTDSASAAVDAAGGFHLAYAAYGPLADGNEAYYAYCAANCGSESSWVKVILIDRVEEVQLALTSAGHPRLLLFGPNPDYSTDFYKYAACDVNCTINANWTILDVTTSTYSLAYLNSYSGHHYFALDKLDRPRFLYRKTIADAYYVYCDSACTKLANWWEYLINPVIVSDPTNLPTLTFTSAGQPRITAVLMGDPGSKSYLNYIACDTDCINQANWTYTALMERGSGHVRSVLHFTSTGQPRLVFNQGSINSGPAGYLWYWWCNTACTEGANWAGSSVGAQGQAEDPDLALDALNRPRIVFKDKSPDGLGYAWCNTNCESNSAVWNGGLVEPSSDLDVEWPILPGVGCSPTASYWYNGYRPSLALDTAGNPRIGYVAQHLVQTGSSCSSKEDQRAVRFMFFNQP